MAEKIYFNGIGLASALGASVQSVLTSIQQKNCVPTAVNVAKNGQSYEVPYHLIAESPLDLGPDRQYQIIDRVIEDALSDAGLTTQDLTSMGLFVGSTAFDIFAVEQSLQTQAQNLEKSLGTGLGKSSEQNPEQNSEQPQAALSDNNILSSIRSYQSMSERIVEKYSMTGPVYTFNTACSSAANALMYAADLVRRGDIERAIVLGAEFYNETTVCGFSGLELISQKGMRPFDKNRDGLVLGEACGAVIISREKAAHNFGFVSAANVADNYSITACNPDGSTIEEAIKLALKQAEIKPEDIRMVKAHGTASLSNDESEAAGLQRVFSNIPPVACIKPYLGHTLGACGIVELIVLLQSLLNEQVLLPLHKTDVDETFNLDFVDDTYVFEPGYFLLNYFGFGGNNTAVVISNV